MLDTLMEVSPDLILVVDRRGVIRRVGPQVTPLLHYEPAELIGQPVEVLVPEATRAAHVALRTTRFAAEDEQRPMGRPLALRARRKDGRLVPVDISLRPWDGDGEPCVLAVIRDVSHLVAAQRSAEKHARDLKALNARLSDFAHVIAHDLKAPLRGMAYHVEWLRDELLSDASDDARLALDRLQVLTDRMASLIDGVLRFSRAGLGPVDPAEPIDIEALLAELATTLAVPKGFTINAAGEMPQVLAWKTGLGQVLTNLVVNAFTHHDRPAEGHVTLSVAPAGPFHRFTVTDDGPGVAPEDRKLIFELFETGGRDATAGHGTGVGLAIVAALVGRVGGGIEVEDAPGGGTCFHFTWPRDTEEECHG